MRNFLIGVGLTLLLIAAVVVAQVTIEGAGTHYFPGRLQTGPTKLANLGTCTATQRAGVMVWCPNCGCGAPCVSGSGAYAFCLGANGWVCL